MEELCLKIESLQDVIKALGKARAGQGERTV